MLRKIINIDEDKCDGCGLCVPKCHEGALQIIDGKARLISDLFCDGLGACIGFCPKGALQIEEREAEPYDEIKTMKYIVQGGANVIKAHLNHLLEHNEFEYFNQAVEFLKENQIAVPLLSEGKKNNLGRPGPINKEICNSEERKEAVFDSMSNLSNWPIQLQLINPSANLFKDNEILLAADCAAFAVPRFQSFLEGKKLIIACPKLDGKFEEYVEKLRMIIEQSKTKKISILIIEVPCCAGLMKILQKSIINSELEVDIDLIIIGIDGSIKRRDTIKI